MTDAIGYVATLVLAKKDKAQFDTALQIISQHLNTSVSDTPPHTLSSYKACDIYFDHIPTDLQTHIAATLHQAGIKADICIQPRETRKKTLLICDMDSTLIGQECIDELADFAGVKDRVSEITERAMRGEIDFDGALRERVGLLAGLPLSTLQTCFDTRIRINTGADILAQTMKAHGAKTVIVSGGFTFFTSRIARLCGFEAHQANTLLEKDGHLTGEVGLPILGRQAKQDALMAHSEGAPHTALAIGDGANDLAMIQAAGLGIAYYAKPAVSDAAHCAISYSDLTTALYYQGYSEHEFIKKETS